jgi:hypothetical protein
MAFTKRILDWSQKIENSPSCPRAQPIQEKEESQIENLIKYPILAISKLYDELGPSVSQHVVDEAAEEVFVSGKFHDQGDAKWMVIRGQLRGHNNTPCG